MVKDERVIHYPLMTEDAVNLIESENKLIFIVSHKSDKSKIKKTIEELYAVGVREVNVLITPKGLKKAYVKLKPEYKASDLAIKLGIL